MQRYYRLLAVMLVVLTTVAMVGTVAAQCSGGGTPGDDNVNCSGPANGNIDTGDGDDNVNVGGPVNGNIDTGDGNDNVNAGGPVNGNIDTGDGNDNVNASGPVNGNIDMGGGDDTLNANGPINGNVNGGDGEDTLNLNGEFCDRGKIRRSAGNATSFENIDDNLSAGAWCSDDAPEVPFRFNGEITIIIQGSSVADPSAPVRVVCDAGTQSLIFLQITNDGRGVPAFTISDDVLDDAMDEAQDRYEAMMSDDDDDDDDDDGDDGDDGDDDDEDFDIEVLVFIFNNISVIASPDVIVIVAPDVNSGELVYMPFNHNVCSFQG